MPHASSDGLYSQIIIVSALEEILKTKASKEKNQAILNKLESLKPSAEFEWLGRIADVIAVFDASIKVFQILI